MTKQKSNNPDTMILALSTFIFESVRNSMINLEEKEEVKEIAKEFNAQPPLKRFMDFTILYFWIATNACESRYEDEDFLRICDGMKKSILKQFSEIAEKQEIFDVVLEDYVKDKDELVLFYRQFPPKDKLKVNLHALLSIFIDKRSFDYNTTLQLDLTEQIKKVPSLFLTHIFGKVEYEYEELENIMLHAYLSVSISATRLSCAKVIVDIENLLVKNPDLNFNLDSLFRIIKKKEIPLDEEIKRTGPFIRILKNIVIGEEDCGTFNGITVQAIMQGDKIIKNFYDRIIHRFALEQVINIQTNQKIVRSGEEITKEKLEAISSSGIKEIRIRSALTCESEKGICSRCYGTKNIVGNTVRFGEDAGLEAAYFWNEVVINYGIKELLSPKLPEDSAILSEIDGFVEVKSDKNNSKKIFVKSNTGLIKEYYVAQGKVILIRDGESVIAGQQLTSGKISSHTVLRICGEKKLFDYLTQQILPYLSVANYDERLIEILLRQILKIEIESPGDTSFSIGQIVNKTQFNSENVSVMKKNKQPAVGIPIFIGIEL